MAALSAPAKNLLADGNFSLQDVTSLGRLFDQRQVTRRDIEALASRYSDSFGGSVDAQLQQLMRRAGASVRIDPPIRNINLVLLHLQGGGELSESNAPKAMTKQVQRGLMALANRTHQPALGLPSWGADADFGDETKQAIKAFRASVGLPAGATVDLQTAQKLNEALLATTPPPFTGPGTVGPGPKEVVKAAQHLVDRYGENYGVGDAWYSIDPNHAMGTGEKTGLRGRWKCNLFACQTLVQAGFEPPYYGDGGRGNYPIANELYKWSRSSTGGANHSRDWGTKPHFDLIGEANVEQMAPENRERYLGLLLSQAEPGDLIIVDHVGSDGADGGHCRVVIDNADWDRGNGHIQCAQASYERGEVQDERISEFTKEERVWILRPNRPQRPQ